MKRFASPRHYVAEEQELTVNSPARYPAVYPLLPLVPTTATPAPSIKNRIDDSAATVPSRSRVWDTGLNHRSSVRRLEFFQFNDEYVQRLRCGDPVTERHFTEYFSALLDIKLRARLRSSQAAEDVRQETFLRVLRALRGDDGLRDGRKLGAYVNAICNNVLLEQYRSHARYSQMPDNVPEVEDPASSAECIAVSEETRRTVREVLSEMPEKNRDLLRKVFFEERDRVEVCREMGVDVNYLRVLLHRARIKFKDRLLARAAVAK